jgi:Fe-S oxidoreductase
MSNLNPSKGAEQSNVIEKLSQEILSCAQCNYCRVCPPFQLERWESVSPRGKLYLLKINMTNGTDLDVAMVKDFFKCTTCGLCETVCQSGIPLLRVWEDVRYEFVRRKLAPLPVHRKLADRINISWNPYGEDRSLRDKWFPEGIQINRDSEILYFAGCTASYRTKELAISTVKLLSHLEIDFNYLGHEEVCCGSTLFRTGQKDAGERILEKNIKIWEKAGVKTIITTCAGCYRTFAIDYPEICESKGIDYDFEVCHLSQFTEKFLGNRTGKKLSGKATYHDPCHLGRHAGVYDEPRKLIKATGLELVEMESNREMSFCCGAGGGVRAQFRNLSLEMGKRRIKEALETGADYLISCCPFCKVHLSHSKKELGENRLEILDISELLVRTFVEFEL